jgi:serine/threonine protein kinase
MNYLHCDGPVSVIHRDLKSCNILLSLVRTDLAETFVHRILLKTYTFTSLVLNRLSDLVPNVVFCALNATQRFR